MSRLQASAGLLPAEPAHTWGGLLRIDPACFRDMGRCGMSGNAASAGIAGFYGVRRWLAPRTERAIAQKTFVSCTASFMGVGIRGGRRVRAQAQGPAPSGVRDRKPRSERMQAA